MQEGITIFDYIITCDLINPVVAGKEAYPAYIGFLRRPNFAQFRLLPPILWLERSGK